MKKKLIFSSLAVAAFCLLSNPSDVYAHGGEHHPEPGYGNGHGCQLSGNFHHYDHQDNYGQNKNIWCNNGSNQQLNQHHGGNTVNADLPADSSFVGGFCIKSDIDNGGVLDIGYKDLVAHDKVWLLSKDDGSYYPIDKTSSENNIAILDNGWADMNPTQGVVESEVLLSARNSGNGNGNGNGNHDGGGSGGCTTGAGGIASLIAAIGFCFGRKP
jgi:hypothetical protein